MIVFHWSLIYSKSPPVLRTRLNMLTDLTNAVVWMISVCSLTSNSFCPLTLETVASALIIIGITVTFMFHCFLVLWQGLSTCFSFRFFGFHSGSRWDGKVNYLAGSLFLLIITGLLARVRYSVYILKSQRIFWVSSARTESGLCIYHLAVWLNFSFLYNSQWIIFPTQPCLVLYPFYANLLHLLIMWLIVSCLSTRKINLLFCCVLFNFILT